MFRTMRGGAAWVALHISGFSGVVAGLACLAILLVILADVAGRYFLHQPLPGALELIELGMLILSAFSLVYAGGRRMHLRNDLLDSFIPDRVRRILKSAAALLGAVFWGIVAWRVLGVGMATAARHSRTDTLRIEYGPLVVIVGIALVLFAIVLVAESLDPREDGDGEGQL